MTPKKIADCQKQKVAVFRLNNVIYLSNMYWIKLMPERIVYVYII